jgi:hypothetical protein
VFSGLFFLSFSPPFTLGGCNFLISNPFPRIVYVPDAPTIGIQVLFGHQKQWSPSLGSSLPWVPKCPITSWSTLYIVHKFQKDPTGERGFTGRKETKESRYVAGKTRGWRHLTKPQGPNMWRIQGTPRTLWVSAIYWTQRTLCVRCYPHPLLRNLFVGLQLLWPFRTLVTDIVNLTKN